MRRSWLGLQLLLGCVLLLAVFVAQGKCFKGEEESSSEEERQCGKRHHCVEEGCEKRCPHEEECCCCEKRRHHEEEECGCKKRHHQEEECCCCCEKRRHHEEDKCCKNRHSHGGEAGRKKHRHVGKKHPKKRHPHLEELEEASSDSSERYKRIAEADRRHIMQEAAQSLHVVRNYRKDQAIAHYNQENNGPYYKHLEDAQVEVKKALGIMVYVKMVLGKTNCTKNQEKEAGVEYSRAYLEKEGCQLLPQSYQEKHNCTFDIFIDMRTEKQTVVSQDCIIIPGIKQLPKRLKGLPF
ncbi:uncharacterized protein M6D78_016158 [Vipera latastei]